MGTLRRFLPWRVKEHSQIDEAHALANARPLGSVQLCSSPQQHLRTRSLRQARHLMHRALRSWAASTRLPSCESPTASSAGSLPNRTRKRRGTLCEARRRTPTADWYFHRTAAGAHLTGTLASNKPEAPSRGSASRHCERIHSSCSTSMRSAWSWSSACVLVRRPSTTRRAPRCTATANAWTRCSGANGRTPSAALSVTKRYSTRSRLVRHCLLSGLRKRCVRHSRGSPASLRTTIAGSRSRPLDCTRAAKACDAS
jgi:hypothetical protein